MVKVLVFDVSETLQACAEHNDDGRGQAMVDEQNKVIPGSYSVLVGGIKTANLLVAAQKKRFLIFLVSNNSANMNTKLVESTLSFFKKYGVNIPIENYMGPSKKTDEGSQVSPLQEIISKFNIQKEDILFFDDSKANVAEAKENGFNAICVKSVKDLHEGLGRAINIKSNLLSNRFFYGKYGAYSDLKVGKIKNEGAEIGAFFSCSKTNPGKQDEKINFLGKLIKNPIEEKIYMDIVRYFANAPSTRLMSLSEEIVKDCAIKSMLLEAYEGMMPGEFDFDKEVWQGVNGGLKDRFPKVKKGKNIEYVTYLSKLIPGYRNLEDYEVNDLNQKIKFKDYIEKYQTFPSSVIIDEHEYPLTGIMKNAATALFIGDNDWLGGSCKNTGAYVENINGTDYAIAINVDAGFAADTDIALLKPSKNFIPYNCNFSSKEENKNSIHIDKLPSELYNEFFQSLYLIVHRYPEDEERMGNLLNALIKRNGAFNDPLFDTKILPDDKTIEIINKLKNRIQELRDTFSIELQEYAENNAELLNEQLCQEQKIDHELIQHYNDPNNLDHQNLKI